MKQHLLVGILALSAAALTASLTGCTKDKETRKVSDFQPLPVNTFMKHWHADLGMGSATVTNVYLFDDFIIVYGSDLTAHVVDRHTGTLKWIHPLAADHGAQHEPSVFGDRIIYPATSSFKVYSAKTGRLISDNPTNFAIRAGGAGAGQFYYVPADYPNGGRLVALDLERRDALPRWEVMTVRPIRSQPVHRDGITYFAAENGKVYAVNEQRNSVWALDDNPDGSFQAGPVLADLTFDGGTVYVPSMDTKLYALNQASGKIKWQYYASGVPLQDACYVTSDTVYQLVRGKGLVAITKNPPHDEMFRKPKWTASDAIQFLADDDKFTYVRLKDGSLAGLDKANGTKKFVSRRKDFIRVASNPKDGQIFAVTPNGQLWCIRSNTKAGTVGEIVMNAEFIEVAAAQ